MSESIYTYSKIHPTRRNLLNIAQYSTLIKSQAISRIYDGRRKVMVHDARYKLFLKKSKTGLTLAHDLLSSCLGVKIQRQSHHKSPCSYSSYQIVFSKFSANTKTFKITKDMLNPPRSSSIARYQTVRASRLNYSDKDQGLFSGDDGFLFLSCSFPTYLIISSLELHRPRPDRWMRADFTES